MTSSQADLSPPQAVSVEVFDDSLIVHLSDGRTVPVPLDRFPRLSHATVSERKSWRLIGRGQGIRWPSLDEDISVEDLLADRGSGESIDSLERWLTGRR